jgi:hypothetical protein
MITGLKSRNLWVSGNFYLQIFDNFLKLQIYSLRTELLLQQESGYLETEEGDAEEFTARITQTQLRKCVDEESAAKGFELNLAQVSRLLTHLNQVSTMLTQKN